MSKCIVLPVRYVDILDAPNASEMLAEYAQECSVSDADPQVEMYAAMEQFGSLHCFGAFVNRELVGFVSVLSSIMPHNGKRMATVESLFVVSARRESGAGDALLSAARDYTAESGCAALLYTARIGSRLETILSRRSGCQATHTQFTEWLCLKA